jgi:predicted GNAT family N-acyltransferase
MVTVRIADFEADYAALRAIRFTVFVDEQRVPEDIEIDEDDPRCIHVLALDDAVPIGTGRIDIENSGKIGRVAVLASHRRSGVGEAVMRMLHAIALEHGVTRCWCHAQVSAAPFYEKLGYRITDAEPFDEAGIPHVQMECRLAGDPD